MRYRAAIRFVALALCVGFAVGCSTNSASDHALANNADTGGADPGTGLNAPFAIALVASPSTVSINGSATIQAAVTTAPGSAVPDGVIVTFNSSDSTIGAVTPQGTTANGAATATFTATAKAGAVTITAKAGAVTQTITLTVASSPVSIEFLSATPPVIGLKGTGQTEVSTITFFVKDINGSPVSDGTTVSFVMAGPSGGRQPADGGEYLATDDGTPTTASSVTAGGSAAVTLHSGTRAGNVAIVASVTVSGSTISASTGPLSIGGGVAAANHSALASNPVHLAGLAFYGLTSTVSAFLADRYGNYNVLEGTTVSFFAEAGAIDRSGITDSTGAAQAIFRTQTPAPDRVTIEPWENNLITYLNATYDFGFDLFGNALSPIPTDGSVHPRNGWSTILGTFTGEESFIDENLAGRFTKNLVNPLALPCPAGYSAEIDAVSGNRSECFIDEPEPFLDRNDNGTRDDGSGSDAFEEYVDTNQDNIWNGPNGVWDGPGCTTVSCQPNKVIGRSTTIGLTNGARYCALSPPTSFALGNGGSRTIRFVAADQNLNLLEPGTTISVSAAGATLSGETSYTVLDGLPYGPKEIVFTVSDLDATTTKTSSVSVVVTVTPPVSFGCTRSVSGTID